MKSGGWQKFYDIYAGTGLDGLRSLSDRYFEKGKRRKLISLSRFLGSKDIFDPLIVKREIISLLVIGKEGLARKRLESLKQENVFSAAQRFVLERYLDRASLSAEAEHFIAELRGRLVDHLELSSRLSGYLAGLASFSDIIVVSNSAGLSFSQAEKQCLLAMERPLFVYLNIGNPLLCVARGDFYCPSAAEVVIGSYQHVVGFDHGLIFRPMEGHQFLGCLMRVEKKWYDEWRGAWKNAFAHANPHVQCQELKEVSLVESLYPLSLASADCELPLKRVPTIGAIALALADGLRAVSGSSVSRVWAAGLSMSASYIFEACFGISLHDFPFEKLVLESRLSSGLVRSIGSVDQASPELGARQHMLTAGQSVAKLNSVLR